jgi:hypothetical protein
MRCVFLFETVHQVVKAEKFLKEKGFSIDLIPVPREISSDCGVAIELPWEDRQDALLALERSSISILEFYVRDQEGRFEKGNRIGHSFDQ